MKRTTRKQTPAAKPTKSSSSKKIVVGCVFADWCGHCRALKPIWAQMKKIIPMDKVVYEDINSNNQDAHIDKINRTYGVNMSAPQGYPYIFKIAGGQVHEYTGDRDAHKMKQWFIGGEGGDNTNSKQNSGSESFGKGIFRGGIKTKTKTNRRATNHRKTNFRKTQKSFWSRMFS